MNHKTLVIPIKGPRRFVAMIDINPAAVKIKVVIDPGGSCGRRSSMAVGCIFALGMAASAISLSIANTGSISSMSRMSVRGVSSPRNARRILRLWKAKFCSNFPTCVAFRPEPIKRKLLDFDINPLLCVEADRRQLEALFTSLERMAPASSGLATKLGLSNAGALSVRSFRFFD